ncbi:hypothetical protein F2Q70_00004527 [Brassica cretica]|uniref:Uncharacterized protein n=1 Tax=Brassica cretica TaxID=69181 RepID=A0A8S9ITD0_BRACR|nr:hypothetical protein F2Q70_00004527 [Brassica cretica]
MKSSEYPEEFPRKFRGNTKFGFLAFLEINPSIDLFTKKSSEYTEGHVPQNIPRNCSLGIFRGTSSSEYTEGHVPRNIPRNISVGIFLSIDVYMSKTHRSMKVRGNIPTMFSLGIFRGHFRQTNGPRNFLGNLFPRNSVGKFRGISEERRNSEELFPTTCFVGMSSE